MCTSHTFHIPVMGTGFTIDSPIRVARYGISSVISLVDDTLIEDVRRFYALKHGEDFVPIHKHDEDWRARRITEYLNLVDRIVKKQVEDLKKTAFEAGTEITKYFEFLPDASPLKALYQKMLRTHDPVKKKALQTELRSKVVAGRIDVNIMTKIDRINFSKDGSLLPEEYSDALAALRGYAESTLHSAIVFSAGFNRRLYSYIEKFKDFYADATGKFKKEIILKVSDYRSAITQGKFLAKKGLWVSEYRVESGLNCGGHAFVGPGNLLGPILEELAQRRGELTAQLGAIYREALKLKNKFIPEKLNPFRLTAQGGIGTTSEDTFLKRHYHVSSTGWGSPFLLVEEAVQIDKETRNKLAAANENELFTSDVSPLNVLFNNLRTSACEIQKRFLINKGQPGSPCLRGHLVSNTEFTEKPICTASRVYQKLKLEALKALGLSQEEYVKEAEKITVKACLCAQLGDGVYRNLDLEKKEGTFPAVCPGPNLAYFNRPLTLKEMIDHIYGRINIMPFKHRPHMFIKDLELNIVEFERMVRNKIAAGTDSLDAALEEFRKNMNDGILYYRKLFPTIIEEPEPVRARMLEQLEISAARIDRLYATLPYSS